MLFQHQWRGFQESEARFFSVMCGGGTRGSKCELKSEVCACKAFFTMRSVKQWDLLPGEVVHSSSMEVFKIQLDKALRKQVCSHG